MTNGDRKEFLIVLLVEDHPGVTMKVVGMFARRGHNMISVTAAPSERDGLSRIVIKIEGTENQVQQIQKQMNKLIEVIKVQVLNMENCIIKELALMKLNLKDDAIHQKMLSFIEIYHGKIIDVDLNTMTVQMVGSSEKIDSFIEVMKDLSILKEISRSGNVALYRGSDSINVRP